MTAISSDTIQALLTEHLDSPSEVRVNYDGSSAQIIVVAQSFEGMSRIKKQQQVYAALQAHIADGSIHAVTMETLTPSEWDKVKHFR